MINDLNSVFIRELWTAEDIMDSTEVKNFVSGSHITSNFLVAKAINGADSGQTLTIPFIQAPEYEEAFYASDSDNEIVSRGITKSQTRAYIGFYSTAFGQYNIVKYLKSGIEPLEAAVSMFGDYWATHIQRRQINTLKGVKASNILNNSSDLILDAKDSVISYDLVLDALQLLGDKSTGFSTICMHSAVVTKLTKLNAITTVIDSERGLKIKMYNSLQIIENDLFAPTYDNVLAKNIYPIIVLKDGAFIYEASTKVVDPVVIVKNEKAGDGYGKTEVISRFAYLLHPDGYEFKLDTVPTDAELTAAATWNRVFEQKHSKIVFLDCQI